MNKIRISAVIAASALAAGLAAAVPAATAATRGNPPSPGAAQLTGPMRFAPTIHYRTMLARPRALHAGTVESLNWSGYAITAKAGQTIGKVQALFTIPNVDCARSTLGTNGALFSDWVGLDGFTTNTVEQIGVAADCTSASGPATYFSFYEMFPNPGVVITGVNPGDAIVVVVQRVSNGWSLLLQDRTTGGSIHTVQPCPAGSTCKDANGEVITEDYNGSVPAGYNLADFGLDNQTDVLAYSGAGQSGGFTSNGLWNSTTIDMANGSDVMAVPGPLYGGQAFYLRWALSS